MHVPKPTLALVLLLMTSIAAVAVADQPRSASGTPGTAPGPASAAADLPLVVSAAWLAARINDPDLVLLHAGDAKAFRKAHIAGARHVSIDDISVSVHDGTGLMFELPPAEELRRRLEALGISNGSRVVVYFGDDWLAAATRVMLTLDAAGLGSRTALLDGGMPAWVRAGQPVSDAAPKARQGVLAKLTIRPIIVDATTVVASLGKPGFAVVDARDKAFYDGTETGDSHNHAHRTGHIAGALSIPFDSVFDERGLLRSPDDLKARFAKAGVAPGDTVIGYCHIGLQATAMLFAARRLGHPVRLYDGSFEDWSLFHPGYPVATTPGSAPAQAAEGKTETKPAAKASAKPASKTEGKP
jgi:thiosulfate/3-mercaptopyruvate sulfurtransferase